MIIFLLIPLIILISILRSILYNPKSEYEKYLEEALGNNPDYINWLSDKDYKLGLGILKRIERDRNKTYKRWGNTNLI